MNSVGLALEALVAGLRIWQHKDSTKYLDKAFKLRKDFYAEFNSQDRDDARLDNIEFELRLLISSFSAEVGKSLPSDKP